MLDKIKDFINNYINNSEIKIIVESVVKYGENKLEYALSIEDYMASISILPDYTYDFFVLEIDSEEMILNKTKYFSIIDDLFKEIEGDLGNFVKLKK